MNTSKLKKFSQEARIKLLQQVTAKLDFVLNTDSSELREKATQLKKLQEAINATSKEQVIDKVAYTWFNRLMALRFMDANNYQPLGLGIVTPKQNFSLPEILQEAKQGHIPQELPVNHQHILNLLDGKLPSTNPQNEAYKELLIGACNHLNTMFPFLFEKLTDYTELLLPDDLISDFSIVTDIRNGMTAEDCQEVEIIGWLYQFYISEKKDEVFASKGKVKREDIPAATQLFTPRWIVEYMVQNTVGKLWLQNNPGSNLRQHMPYFIESPSVQSDDYLKVNSVEEITLLDQACGSGHILVYGFELLAKIYEEEGYNAKEIPQLIIEKNLFGFEIDERAAQLAGFALLMKARAYHRRVFRKELKPNILCYQDLDLKVYNIDGYDKVVKVPKNSSLLKGYIEYGYCIAENINHTWEEDYTDEDTGETVKIERVKIKLKKGQNTHPTNKKDILTFGNDEILFFKDEIKDVFRLANIELPHHIYLDLTLMLQATNLGSLIIPMSPFDFIKEAISSVNGALTTNDIFLKQGLNQIKNALEQLLPLSRKYHCIVDNPPYMGGGNMNKELAAFVKSDYKNSKSDLMACFMEAGLKALHPKGFLGMINQHSWMFLSSYEKLREKLIKETFFDTLLHLGPRTFPEIGGEVVQNASFTFWNTQIEDKGSYISLVDEGTSELKRIKTIDAIQNPNCGWFYTANQKSFKKIPSTSVSYWVKESVFDIFENSTSIKSIATPQVGLQTGNNGKFIRQWYEVKSENFLFPQNLTENYIEKWIACNKGGEYKKWYGNIENIINWKSYGKDIKSNVPSAVIRNEGSYFKQVVGWSKVGGGKFALRLYKSGYVHNDASCFFVSDIEVNLLYICGLLNSSVRKLILEQFNPTLNYTPGMLQNVPIIIPKNQYKNSGIDLIKDCISESKFEYDSRESSWDFKKNELIRAKGQDLEETYDLYQKYWEGKFFQLHKNEEELNKQFIKIYGLQEELTPDVPLEDITILKEETKIVNNELVFQEKEIFKQFISYAVGCMFGRYTLDKEGLILANQGETLEDYLSVTERSRSDVSFLPDDDNIIPILDDEWFEDDIVGRFYEFLKVSFGKENYEKNLAFVEECLGTTIRKYFVKDFYKDHIKRYKKRPIYWQFSSPKGSFNVLIYMHRYTPDTLSQILNDYLVEYREKLNNRIEQLNHVMEAGSSTEQTKAAREKDKIKVVLLELQEYDREILYPLASERIEIDLDDGVLVNYNKFGTAIKLVPGLNDKKAKDKVRKFDWINTSEIR